MADETILTFLPWAAPATAALPRAPSAGARAAVQLVATATATGSGGTSSHPAALDLPTIGPGDVTGISTGQVLRTEPYDGATNVETTLFPSVELSLPQLPWLFTGSPPAGAQLTPWLCLVVLPDSDGVSIDPTGRILTAPPAELPDLADAWAWAHVQYSGALPGTAAGDAGDTAPSATVAQALADPTQALARLISPRVLLPYTRYHACIVPTTTAGQAAGLGAAPTRDEIIYAWPPPGDGGAITLPVYFQFSFTTGDLGDFESLAARLAAAGSSAAGLMIQQPGALSTIWPSGSGSQLFTEPMPRILGPIPAPAPEPAGAMPAASRAGAASTAADDGTGPPQGLVTWLTQLYTPNPAQPSLTEPAYGSVQAPLRGDDLAGSPAAVPAWLTELNTDPRLRIAAGYGAQVVAADQEDLVASAFSQIGDLARVNAHLDRGQLARAARGRALGKHLSGLDPLTTLQLLSPIAARLPASAPGISSATSAQAAALTEAAPDPRLPAVVSAAYRRAARPRATPARHTATAGSAPPAVPAALGPGALLPPLTPQPSAPTDRILLEYVSPAATALASSNNDTLRQLAPAVTYCTPMLDKLIALNPDIVLPGSTGIPANTALILQDDPAVIVAYLVGLNHAVQRLLQWRDVPTDRQATPFQWFWGSGPEEINPIGTWPARASLAGQLTGGPNTVLVIRSDLFRRYPRTSVFLVQAQSTPPRFTLSSAAPQPAATGPPAPGVPVPPRYTSLLPPDLRLFIFDVDPRDLTPAPGYFVVFQEQLSETRFGTDNLPPAGPGEGAAYWPVTALTASTTPPSGTTALTNSATVADTTRMPPVIVAIAAERLLPATAATADGESP